MACSVALSLADDHQHSPDLRCVPPMQIDIVSPTKVKPIPLPMGPADKAWAFFRDLCMPVRVIVVCGDQGVSYMAFCKLYEGVTGTQVVHEHDHFGPVMLVTDEANHVQVFVHVGPKGGSENFGLGPSMFKLGYFLSQHIVYVTDQCAVPNADLIQKLADCTSGLQRSAHSGAQSNPDLHIALTNFTLDGNIDKMVQDLFRNQKPQGNFVDLDSDSEVIPMYATPEEDSDFEQEKSSKRRKHDIGDVVGQLFTSVHGIGGENLDDSVRRVRESLAVKLVKNSFGDVTMGGNVFFQRLGACCCPNEAQDSDSRYSGLRRYENLVNHRAKIEVQKTVDAMNEITMQLPLPMNQDSLKREFVKCATSCLDSLRSVLDVELGIDLADRRAFMLAAGKELQSTRRKLFQLNDETSMVFCKAALQRLWDEMFGFVRKSPELIGGGKRAADTFVQMFLKLEKRYNREAMGQPARVEALCAWIPSKANILETFVTLSVLREEMQDDDVSTIDHFVEMAKGADIKGLLSQVAALETAQLEELAEFATFTQACKAECLGSLRASAKVVQHKMDKQYASAAKQLSTSSAECEGDLRTITHAAQRNFEAYTDNSVKEYKQMGKDCERLGKELQECDKGMKEIQARRPWWQKILQVIAGVALSVAGVALIACTAGAGAFVGGMLLGAGLSTTFKAATSKHGLEWGDFAKTIGVGLVTGAVSAGIGAGFSAAATAACNAVGTFSSTAGTMAVHGAIHAGVQGAGGAVAGLSTRMFENLIDGRKWDDGFGKAALLGGVGGAVAGGLQGLKAGHSAGTPQSSTVPTRAETTRGIASQVTESTLVGGGAGFVIGGIGSVLEGGSFGDGALAGAFSGAVGGMAAGIGGGLAKARGDAARRRLALQEDIPQRQQVEPPASAEAAGQLAGTEEQRSQTSSVQGARTSDMDAPNARSSTINYEAPRSSGSSTSTRLSAVLEDAPNRRSSTINYEAQINQNCSPDFVQKHVAFTEAFVEDRPSVVAKNMHDGRVGAEQTPKSAAIHLDRQGAANFAKETRSALNQIKDSGHAVQKAATKRAQGAGSVVKSRGLIKPEHSHVTDSRFDVSHTTKAGSAVAKVTAQGFERVEVGVNYTGAEPSPSLSGYNAGLRVNHLWPKPKPEQ